MTSRIFSGATLGFDGHLIDVESDTSIGLPSLSVVGLGGKAIIEARERVRSAIGNSGFSFPAKRITINLAPADLPKGGTQFDLPIAIAILTVSGQLLDKNTDGILFAGELALDGTLRPIKGAIQLAELARNNGIQKLIIPRQNALQARLSDGVEVIGLDSLQSVFRYLKGDKSVVLASTDSSRSVKDPEHTSSPLLDDVFGQVQAKRAIQIAAAGHHNILFDGPPGAGKTLLAQVLRNLLPPMSVDDKIATTKLHSLSLEHYDDIITTRPFRTPHHSASRASLIGGGSHPGPGEISLAHLGVLFLDELPEYPRTSLEALRQPLEDKAIVINRSYGSIRFPADFMLVATKNPCPCGYLGDPERACVCSPGSIAAYINRLSGPLLDRIDIVVHVARPAHESLLDTSSALSTIEHNGAKQAIAAARAIQSERYGSSLTNASISGRQLKTAVVLPQDARAFLLQAAKKLSLSARATFKTIRVARSIADLEGENELTIAHIGEALQYRADTTLR